MTLVFAKKATGGFPPKRIFRKEKRKMETQTLDHEIQPLQVSTVIEKIRIQEGGTLNFSIFHNTDVCFVMYRLVIKVW